MCEKCSEHEFICAECGSVVNPEYSHLVPYSIVRKEIKNLVWTSDSENFVWILMFEGRMVKVGQGSLIKLLNETRPNASYIRFDSVRIYWCASTEECKSFACRLMGEIKGLVNRRGVVNTVYKTRAELRWSNKVNPDMREMILGDPEFRIAGVDYWDVRKLVQFGVS